MTIDERLKRLVQRHEALTETVEILTRDVQELRGSVTQLVIASRQDGENIRALARIAERRLPLLLLGADEAAHGRVML